MLKNHVSSGVVQSVKAPNSNRKVLLVQCQQVIVSLARHLMLSPKWQQYTMVDKNPSRQPQGY